MSILIYYLIFIRHFFPVFFHLIVLNGHLDSVKLEKSENCEGCACESQCQRHHDCIMMPFQDRINILFDVLIEKVNEEDINEMKLDTMREEGNEIKGECISKMMTNGLKE